MIEPWQSEQCATVLANFGISFEEIRDPGPNFFPVLFASVESKSIEVQRSLRFYDTWWFDRRLINQLILFFLWYIIYITTPSYYLGNWCLLSFPSFHRIDRKKYSCSFLIQLIQNFWLKLGENTSEIFITSTLIIIQCLDRAVSKTRILRHEVRQIFLHEEKYCLRYKIINSRWKTETNYQSIGICPIHLIVWDNSFLFVLIHSSTTWRRNFVRVIWRSLQ